MGGRASHMAGVLFPRPAPGIYCCLHNKVHSPRPDLRALCHLAPLTSPASPPPFNQPCDSPSITQTWPIFPASRLCLMLSPHLGVSFPQRFSSQIFSILQGSGLISSFRKVGVLFLSPRLPQPISGPSCGLVDQSVLCLGSVSIQSWGQPPLAYSTSADAQHHIFLMESPLCNCVE